MKQIVLVAFLLMSLLPLEAQLVQHIESPLMPRTTRVGNRYYVNNEVMCMKAYEGYLKNTCPEAYGLFHNGRTLMIAGWSCFGVGGGLLVSGIPFLLSTLVYAVPDIGTYIGMPSPSPTASIVHCRVGCFFALGGVAGLIASLPLLKIGYNRMHNAAQVYNAKAYESAPTYWTLSAYSITGVGATLNFYF